MKRKSHLRAMASHGARINLTTSESISLPVNSADKLAISKREWQNLRSQINGMTDDTRKWELSLTSSLSVLLAFALPVLSINKVTEDGSISWLFVLYLSVTAFALAGSVFSLLAMRSHKRIDVTSRESLLSYMDEITSLYREDSSSAPSLQQVEWPDDDVLYQEAVRIAREAGKVSTSFLQRKLRIGYARSARIVERMEEEGVASASDGSRPRTILKR